ncbi:hypothetical protein I4U23_013148 [Adineta vaga]|nr:hypothetical protein I4U23_013148 [Adineta vaga]
MQKPLTVGIVGGGIAGLVSAYYLAQKAALSKLPHLRILLFERSSRFGGWIRTDQLGAKYDSHIFELGARTLRLQSGNASLSNHSAINTLKLLEQLNIFDDQFCPIEKSSPANKNKLLYSNEKLINLNDLSLIFGGKPLRYPPIVYALYEYFSKEGRFVVQDETIKSFIYRRFGAVLGEEIVEYLLDPLLKGIYAGSVTNLSARSVLKTMFEREQRHGSIIKGILKSKQNKTANDSINSLFNDLNLKDYASILNKYAIYYLKDGMETLPCALVNHLQKLSNVEIIPNQFLQKIQFLEDHVEISTRSNEKFVVDHLISAIPAFELANLLDDTQHKILRSQLNQIAFVNMFVINLLFRKEDIFPKEAFGYLIPTREHSYLLGVLFDSCIRHQIDKKKHGSQLTVMMGGAWFDELKLGQLTEDQLIDIVMKELKKQMNLDEKPAVYSVARLNKAIPNYNVGHQALLDDIYARIRHDKLPLTLVGNSYRGVGVNNMYLSLIVSTVILVFITGGLTIDCPSSPSKWCESKEIAQACDVTEQCKAYVWKTRVNGERVNLSVYYETLCPDCRQFITSQVWNAYQSILDIVNITFVPYGNARELYRPETKLYQFYCQHGAEECYGNLIHACLINFYPQSEQHMPFIYCMESTEGEMETVATECAQKSAVDYDQITACTHSRLGNQLQHEYAVQTENLQPPHQYVPWITLNGEHTEDMQKQAEKDLIGLICKSYKGSDPPAQCVKNL